jgi:hypothetical protein
VTYRSEEVAAVVALFASPKASFITGPVIVLDGGLALEDVRRKGCVTCFIQALAHLSKESSVSSTTRSIVGRSGRKTSRQASIPFCLAAPPAQPPTLSITW